MSSLLAAARTRRESGFTLIELLTVIVIIGILAAIAIPVFSSQRQRAQDAASVSEARSFVTALESIAAGMPGGVYKVNGTNFPTIAMMAENGATLGKTQDSLVTYVDFNPSGYVVSTANSAGKSTVSRAVVATTGTYGVTAGANSNLSSTFVVYGGGITSESGTSNYFYSFNP